MSKERLEEHTHIAVKKDEYKKLKEQAERVQELEVWRNEVTQNVVARNAEYAKCREQNKRYKELLNKVAYEDIDFKQTINLVREYLECEE